MAACPVLATPTIVRQLCRLVAQGYNAREIEQRLGITHRRVHRIAKRNGIDMQGGLGNNARRVQVVIATPVLAALDTVAAGAGVDRCEMARRILAVALGGSGEAAIRLLGPQSRPKRSYGQAKAPMVGKRAQRAALRAARAAEEAERARLEAKAAAEAIARMPTTVKDAIAAGQHPLRAVRLHLGLRQVDVAERVGMGFHGDTQIGEIERGRYRLTPWMAERLAKAMGVEAAWLRPRTSEVANNTPIAP